LLDPRDMRRRHRFPAKARRPAGESPDPTDVERRRRTLDEKLDEALELTFPASDAFVIV
jgi:hypothetical protein